MRKHQWHTINRSRVSPLELNPQNVADELAVFLAKLSEEQLRSLAELIDERHYGLALNILAVSMKSHDVDV